MQQRYVNAFCIDHDGVIEENVKAGVKFLKILTSSPQTINDQMLAAGLDGVIILRPDDINNNLKLNFPIAVYVDILECDENKLEELSMLNLPTVIPLFENLQRTGEISAQYDTSPAKLMEDMGFLDRDCTILGGSYADKDDLDILGSYGAKMVLCPRMFARYGSILPNIKLMAKHGLSLQMGSGDEKVDFEKEIEFLHLTTLALLENPKIVSKEEIRKIALGEGYEN